jgi:hypothetical protein
MMLILEKGLNARRETIVRMYWIVLEACVVELV